jgi:hypothetical protein
MDSLFQFVTEHPMVVLAGVVAVLFVMYKISQPK